MGIGRELQQDQHPVYNFVLCLNFYYFGKEVFTDLQIQIHSLCVLLHVCSSNNYASISSFPLYILLIPQTIVSTILCSLLGCILLSLPILIFFVSHSCFYNVHRRNGVFHICWTTGSDLKYNVVKMSLIQSKKSLFNRGLRKQTSKVRKFFHLHVCIDGKMFRENKYF